MQIDCDLAMSIWSALSGSMLGVRFGRQQVLFPWTKGFLFWCSTKDFGIRRGAEHRDGARPDDDTGSDHSYRSERTLEKAWRVALRILLNFGMSCYLSTLVRHNLDPDLSPHFPRFRPLVQVPCSPITTSVR